MENLIQLVHIVTAFEERSATQKFSEDAPHRPNVNYQAVSHLLTIKAPCLSRGFSWGTWYLLALV